MNLKYTPKLQIFQNELGAQIDRHPLKRYRKGAILYAQQSQGASQDQSILA